MKQFVLTSLLAAVGALSLSTANAATTWTFDTVSQNYGNNLANSTANGQQFTGSDGSKVSVSAWSNTNDKTTSGATISNKNNYLLEQGYLSSYAGGGLGVKNMDACATVGCAGDYNEGVAPEHSTDNETRYDSVLFKFGSALKLTSVSVGWPDLPTTYDSDIFVLAYTGSTAPANAVSAMAGKSYSQLLTSGWSVVGTPNDTKDMAYRTNQTAAVNTAGIASAYWLIGAFNPIASAAPDALIDYVKLSKLTTDSPTPPSKVPEPASALLVGLALAGLVASRKKR